MISLGFCKRTLERAIIAQRFSSPILNQQFLRPLCQHPPHLSTFAFDSWDDHAVIAGRLVPHPCDDSGFRSLFHGNAFGAMQA